MRSVSLFPRVVIPPPPSGYTVSIFSRVWLLSMIDSLKLFVIMFIKRREKHYITVRCY